MNRALLKAHVEDLHGIVDRSFAIVEEARREITPAFTGHAAELLAEPVVAALGHHLSLLDEVERFLRRARRLIAECEKEIEP